MGVRVISCSVVSSDISWDGVTPNGITDQDHKIRSCGGIVVAGLDIVFDRGGGRTCRSRRSVRHIHIRALLPLPQDIFVEGSNKVGICIVAMNYQIAGWNVVVHDVAVIIEVEDRRFIYLGKSWRNVCQLAFQLVDSGGRAEIHPKIKAVADTELLGGGIVAEGIDIDGQNPEIAQDNWIAIL